MSLLQNSFRLLDKDTRLSEIRDLLKRLEAVKDWIHKHPQYHDQLLEDVIRVFEFLRDVSMMGKSCPEETLIKSAETLIAEIKK